MAIKKILADHAVSALMEEARRFDAMSVHIAKSTNLATSQADEIALWTSKLIDAVTRVQQETRDEAAARSGNKVKDTGESGIGFVTDREGEL
ncbi:hypothetical protein AJ78_08526 [Emergomyces pasteurianus Ep9510]|uniref:Uncharacterized protein n=1 Tax=Emergomyces pasteurianus Ep9510 TaxID=1447872 RepID=A0A1J9Q3H5_9EURO|nr:hypothetical protein AJ78_08526 [Emergomyces pasteurianus Ep9510]